jgi:preprotein translocase subunit YajC
MVENMKKGDKVVTTGGIHGIISGMDEKTVLVQIADNVKVKLDKGSVTIISSDPEPIK